MMYLIPNIKNIMSFSVSSTGKQYIFASFDKNDDEPWMFSFKRFLLTGGDIENYHVGPPLRGQFISSGWFSQTITKESPKDYLFMVIEFEGDFSYLDSENGLFPGIVIELNKIMSTRESQYLNGVDDFIVNNCQRVTNAFLFEFGENVYKNAFELKNDGDGTMLKTTSLNHPMNLVVDVLKIIENGRHSIYISNPEFTL
jgi:hypothetical protein